MAIAPEVEKYLESEGVDYEVIEHPTAYTAQEEAAAAHVSGYEWAKTVIFFTDAGDAIMAVLPASYQVDSGKLQELVGADALQLAEESDFADLYPGCEPGAMPPLGPLYDQPVYVDEHLTEYETIVFNAGDHTEAIRMEYRDFERLAKPQVGTFGRRRSTG